MQFKDYYQVLGVEPTAGDAEIKTAYRRMARKYHPDVSKEAGAEDKFKGVNEAYEALRDPQKRKAYDQLRSQGYRPGEEFRPPPDWERQFRERQGAAGSGGGAGAFSFDDIDLSDLFEGLARGRRGGRGPRGAAPACARRPNKPSKKSLKPPPAEPSLPNTSSKSKPGFPPMPPRPKSGGGRNSSPGR